VPKILNLPFILQNKAFPATNFVGYVVED